jgi:hypothetical protein
MAHEFIKICTGLDVAPLVASLDAQPHLWYEHVGRQSYEGSAHRDTETIFLRWCQGETVEAAFTELDAIDYPGIFQLPESRTLIAEVLRLVESDQVARVIITRLKPGGLISAHADEGVYADHYERFHVPLVSEQGNMFFVKHSEDNGEYAEMKPGELWWFNHKKVHAVINESNQHRIHLIVDCLAPKYRRDRYAV